MTDSANNIPFAAQDLKGINTTLDGISQSAGKVSKSLTSAFANAIVTGKSFDETLKGIALNMSKIFLNAGMKPLTSGLTSLLSSAVSGLAGGGGGAGASIQPFADGGIVAQPTFFGMGGGSAGLMGERGAEAIVPLSRGPDGRLGLAAGGQGTKSSAVIINISTPDAESFRRSEAQISGALARAVARGQRSQ